MIMILQFYVLNLDINFLYFFPKCRIFLLIMIKQDVKINLSLYMNVNDYYVMYNKLFGLGGETGGGACIY